MKALAGQVPMVARLVVLRAMVVAAVSAAIGATRLTCTAGAGGFRKGFGKALAMASPMG